MFTTSSMATILIAIVVIITLIIGISLFTILVTAATFVKVTGASQRLPDSGFSGSARDPNGSENPGL